MYKIYALKVVQTDIWGLYFVLKRLLVAVAEQA
jgi:hypothetical protein